MTDNPRDRLWTLDEVAAYLNVPVATLRYWRTRGEGPRGIKIGGHLRFRAVEVDAWLDEHADAAA